MHLMLNIRPDSSWMVTPEIYAVLLLPPPHIYTALLLNLLRLAIVVTLGTVMVWQCATQR